MKVLFVYPIFPDTCWSFGHVLAFEGKKSAFPPPGLLPVSAKLPENWERRLDKGGRLLVERNGNNTDCTFNFVPKMNKECLVEGCENILRNIFSRQEFYQRALDCRSHFKQNKIEPPQADLINDFRKLPKIVLTLGVREGEPVEF